MSKDSVIRRLSTAQLSNRIYEIAILANSGGDPDDVIKAIIERILEDTGSDYVGIALVDSAQENIVHAWGRQAGGDWFPPGHTQPIGQGIVGRAVAEEKTIVANDVSKESNYVPLFEGMTSELVVPLWVAGVVIGALDAESIQPEWFGRTEQDMLEAVATPVGPAILNARLFQESRHRVEQLALINRVGSIITTTLELDDPIQRVVTDIREQLRYNFVGLALYDEESDRMVLKAYSSKEKVDIPIGHSQSAGEGIVGEVLSTKRSKIVNDLSIYPNHVPTDPSLQSEMCSPLMVGDRLIGVLDAESTEAMAFEAIADYMAQALENASNLEAVSRMRDDLSNMVAHDLRNPLTVITSALGYVSAAISRDESQGHEGTKKYLKAAMASCDNISIMVESILELQRM